MYPSSKDITGIFVHEQAKALVQKGVDVRVISPVPWAPFPLNLILPKWNAYHKIPDKASCEGIDIWYPRYLNFPRSLFYDSSGWRMYQGIKKLVKTIYNEFRFDLIHAHTALPDGFAALQLKDIYNKPVVVTIHGNDLHGTINKNAACLSAVSQVFQRADKVITVSSKLLKIATQAFGPSRNVSVIGNGFPMEKLSFAIPNCKIQEKDFRSILSVSNLITTKGIDINLKAFSQLVSKYPDLKYIIVGYGPKMAHELKKLADKLGVADRTVFTGWQHHNQVFEHMACADIFSLPSWTEAFGVVYVEAMACGKPVIGCEGEGIEDFVEHGKTGMLVKPRDVDSLLSALDFLLSHPEEARAMGDRARKFVLENFTWDKNAEKTIMVYEEVLDGF